MSRPLRKQNPELTHALLELRRAARSNAAPIWGAVAERLSRPRHRVSPLNVGQLDRLARAEETVVVPGKLLADGRISKPLTVAAFDCSPAARSKVHAAGGKILSIHELVQAKPDGAGVRLVA